MLVKVITQRLRVKDDNHKDCCCADKMDIIKNAADKMDMISEICLHWELNYMYLNLETVSPNGRSNWELQLHVSQLGNCESRWKHMKFFVHLRHIFGGLRRNILRWGKP